MSEWVNSFNIANLLQWCCGQGGMEGSGKEEALLGEHVAGFPPNQKIWKGETFTYLGSGIKYRKIAFLKFQVTALSMLSALWIFPVFISASGPKVLPPYSKPLCEHSSSIQWTCLSSCMWCICVHFHLSRWMVARVLALLVWMSLIGMRGLAAT